MFKTFYIHLPSDAKNQSVSALILHALENIKQDSKGERVVLSHFDLVRPYTESDSRGIFYEYSFMTSDEAEERDESIAQAFAGQEAKSTAEPCAVLAGSDGLCSFELDLPSGADQDDELTLIENLARSVEELGNVNILDFIYHDFAESGLRHPYFSVYYTK